MPHLSICVIFSEVIILPEASSHKLISNQLKAFHKRQRGDVFIEPQIFIVRLLKIIIWNGRIEMVNMVNTDVARQPIEEFWDFV